MGRWTAFALFSLRLVRLINVGSVHSVVRFGGRVVSRLLLKVLGGWVGECATSRGAAVCGFVMIFVIINTVRRRRSIDVAQRRP